MNSKADSATGLWRWAVAGLLLTTALIVCPRPLVAAPDSQQAEAGAAESASDPDDRKKAAEADRPESPEQKLQREAAAGVDRLQRAIDAMRGAQRRISDADTSAKTQALQQAAVQDLQQLLARLQRQQRSGQGRRQRSSESEPTGGQQKPPDDQADPENAGSKPERQPQSKPQGAQRNDDKAPDSEERRDQARQAAAEQARRLEMIKDVWGHLPPHLREAMQNSFSEKYLPKYEELVKKYYESLAEKNHNRNRP
jgi:hypothetical protein